MDMKTSPLAALTDPSLLKTDALIGGEWVAAGAAGASRFDVTDPATGLKLADVANLGKISAVVLQGRYLPKSALEAMKQASAQAYAAQALKPLNAALDPQQWRSRWPVQETRASRPPSICRRQSGHSRRRVRVQRSAAPRPGTPMRPPTRP